MKIPFLTNYSAEMRTKLLVLVKRKKFNLLTLTRREFQLGLFPSIPERKGKKLIHWQLN